MRCKAEGLLKCSLANRCVLAVLGQILGDAGHCNEAAMGPRSYRGVRGRSRDEHDCCDETQPRLSLASYT